VQISGVLGIALDVGLLASVLMALFIARRSYTAYNFTGRAHLINFSAGFLFLGVSYLLALALNTVLPPDFGLNWWPRLLVELVGFALIGTSYYTKERKGSLALLVGILLVFAFVTVLAESVQLFVGGAYTGGFHVMDLALVAYTLIQVSRSYTTRIVKGSFYVSWGFGMLTLSEYTWVIWSYNNTFLTEAMASTLRFIALVLLTYSLRK
jgi:hypothetical protein